MKPKHGGPGRSLNFNALPIASRLPTSHALVAVWEKLQKSGILWEDDLIVTGVRSFDVSSPAPTDPNPPTWWDVTVFQYPATSPPTNYIKRLVALPGETVGNFVRIGHSLLVLLFAFVGALLSRRLYLGPDFTGLSAVIVATGVPGREDQPGPANNPDPP